MSVVYVNLNGLVNNTITTEDNSPFPIGQIVDGFLCLELPVGVDLATSWYNNGTWELLPTRPGYYYNWEGGAWVFDKPALVKELKRMRLIRLRFGDWTQLPDVVLTGTQIIAWRTYRQELRDLPSLYPNITSIDEVVWPTPPA